MEELRSGEVSRRIVAPASALYELVSDVTRTGLWAVECEACRWLDGVSAASVGARFEGDNRFEERTWSTVSVVDEAVPHRRFAYHTEGDVQPITRWYITLRPDGYATVVTEGFERVVLPDSEGRAFEDDLFGGRVRHNLANIAVSLERLASLVETAGHFLRRGAIAEQHDPGREGLGLHEVELGERSALVHESGGDEIGHDRHSTGGHDVRPGSDFSAWTSSIKGLGGPTPAPPSRSLASLPKKASKPGEATRATTIASPDRGCLLPKS